MSSIIFNAIPGIYSLIHHLNFATPRIKEDNFEDYKKFITLIKNSKAKTYNSYLENTIWKFGDQVFGTILKDETLNSIFSNPNSSMSKKEKLHNYIVEVVKHVSKRMYDFMINFDKLISIIPFLQLDKKYLEELADKQKLDENATSIEHSVFQKCNLDKINSSRDVYTMFMSKTIEAIVPNLVSRIKESDRIKEINNILEYKSEFRTDKLLKRTREDDDPNEVNKKQKT